MDTINSLISVLKLLIGIGVGMRVIFCLIKMMCSEDEKNHYKKKMINIIIFGVVAEVCLVIKDVIMYYFE